MAKLSWTPWHEVVKLREEIKSGELSLAFFAADIYDVIMRKAPPIYQDPKEFFTLTYPTFNLRELVKETIFRLAGKSEKAIRQLELTYGGGKTHTLITLYHLTSEPEKLPNLPSIQEFVEHIGFTPPKCRTAVLAFDKLDVEKGMEVCGPKGETRWLKNPWSVLAFQIAGVEGLKLLNAEGKEAERETAPAENLLVDLLALPQKEKLSTLILIDEVLMYAREKIGMDPAWRGRLANFFQYLTQAAVKVPRCAIVASLLATDPRKSDQLGKEISQELYTIFAREGEAGVQPVIKDDVAEILRRRFFTHESIKDREAFRPHVAASLKGITALDPQTQKEMKEAEEKFLKSFPFHPELTEVLYTKWTNLEGFQKTRGILRTFALALQESEKWDTSPLIGTNIFLSKPGQEDIASGARELSTIATREEYEGKQQQWEAILRDELEKARAIQSDYSGLKGREVEQAVFATFLHSQPIGQKASTRDLLILLGQTRPDKIELEKALKAWAETSWFLDEIDLQTAETSPDGGKSLPKSWRLGSKPNLTQMHSDACKNRVPPETVDAALIDEIGKTKSLTQGANGAGARVHMLPKRPSDIEDNGEFHYAVLGPSAASEPGKPSAAAKQFINEKTSADNPRIYRNALVLAVPSKDGIEVARHQIRSHLGWLEVKQQLKEQKIDPIRQQMLEINIERSKSGISEAIKQAYCLAVTVSEKDEIQAIKIKVENQPIFQSIKEDNRVRIKDTAVNPEALLPGGPYDLWRENEDSRMVKDLVGSFAQFPRLPKMLDPKAIKDTVADGCARGLFVLRLSRPDRSIKTVWREAPESSLFNEPGLEAVLPEKAALTSIPPALLSPDALPGLWKENKLQMKDLYHYFSGKFVAKIKKEGYEEQMATPGAEQQAIDEAVSAAVKNGLLWLINGQATLWKEEIPTGILTEDACLLPPPAGLPTLDVLPDRIPDAWQNGSTTALSISVALSKKQGSPLPWAAVRDVIEDAVRARLIEHIPTPGNWPCDFSGAQSVKLKVAAEAPKTAQTPAAKPRESLTTEADLKPNQIQDLADQIGEIVKLAAGYDLKFRLQVELGGSNVPKNVVEKINSLLGEISDQLTLG